MCMQGEPGASNRLLPVKEKDNTCTGDASQCCGNCGDMPRPYAPEPPDADTLPTSEQWGPL